MRLDLSSSSSSSNTPDLNAGRPRHDPSKLAVHTDDRRLPPLAADDHPHHLPSQSVQYRSYKRRWFGLLQLSLMNLIVSVDWLTYAPVADAAAQYYRTTLTAINWLSTAFFLAFVVVSPLTIFALHRGPKLAFVVAAILMLVGNWIRYAGSARSDGGNIVVAVVGQVIVGFAQPFILAAPTRYSDIWFTERGRVAATALASLANPLGGALAQLVIPMVVKRPADVSGLVLYVAIISTICCLPAFLLPSHPPTPVGASAETSKLGFRESMHLIVHSPELWIVFVPFAVNVGFFNSFSSLLNQIMVPYGFTNDEAGIGGAILIFVGLVFAAVSSPLIDRTKAFVLALKILLPLIALCYVIFIWMPETRRLAGPYIVVALLGAASFASLPVALEFLTEVSYPLSPEVTSTIAWAGGQLLGAVFILISGALADGPDAHPPGNLKRALIFQGVIAAAACPLPLFLGLFGRRDKVALRRIGSDRRSGVPDASA
ncbi:hypothetical protein XA68_15482 [Ophiocordyceps unilateralis]|uniref:Major facilitator superfamily (MFS) profile domain-containing protein n=1 Tax=Ophiocordyceps unilateralis TaxID=268505 RepID=A0A2A9P810_OPHUN|nr:hypothetical protein XA68_15482 [Ophiocordyceps unilateralis]